MNNERIDLDAIESEWDNYQSDGPIDDYLASLNISRMITELKRCYEEIDAANRCIDQATKELQNCADCGGHREEEGLLHDCQNYCRCDEFFDESASE